MPNTQPDGPRTSQHHQESAEAADYRRCQAALGIMHVGADVMNAARETNRKTCKDGRRYPAGEPGFVAARTKVLPNGPTLE